MSELTGRTAQVPAYTGRTAAAGVDESTAHGEYDAINPVSLTGLRYGRWTLVSALANLVDDLRGINTMHAWAIARDLDLLAVDAVETAASTRAVLDDLDQQVRQAILSVAPSAQARNELRRNPPLRRRDGEETPFSGHALELVRAALLEVEP